MINSNYKNVPISRETGTGLYTQLMWNLICLHDLGCKIEALCPSQSPEKCDVDTVTSLLGLCSSGQPG